ncbi:MAG: META domain-containing protein [Hyphomonadaceae bacterium]|nr:META domain-containing protein [Hyphomonadaceae bacterium]
MAQELGRKALIGLACASAVLAAACASIAPPMQANLAGTRWTVQTIDGERAGAIRAPTVIFGADRRVSGSASCNSYFGTYSTHDGEIDVRSLGRTEMACEQALMRQEEAFIGALDAATRYVVESNGRLMLYGPNERSLTLVRVG